MLNIYLADLQNSAYRYLRNSVPIGMGYVAAYLEEQFAGQISIHTFRKFEEIYESLEDTPPDIIAFGSYTWNTQLSYRTASYLRQRFPEMVITMGGPNVSPNVLSTELMANQHRYIDFFMPNEAEAPMRNLVAQVLEGGRSAALESGVDGCLSINPKTNKLMGAVMDRFDGDINDLPSPYLSGSMDRYLADSSYLPIVQTARGCPYRCTFCVSGKDTWSKIKAFDTERVKAEINYISERAAATIMRLADENFGILKRDIEIANFIMDKRKNEGFPSSVSVYTDKHPTDRVKEINLLMQDLMPFCISFQSMTSNVLDNIKRINLKEREIVAAIDFARDHQLMLVSELIFGLPGETIDSFFQSIDRLMDYRFESVAIAQLRILLGTEMDLPEYLERYEVQIMYAMSENGYTSHPEMENIEIDQWAVSNNTLTHEEYLDGNRFIFLFDFAHYHGFFKEMLFFFEAYGIRATALLMGIIENADLAPLLSGQADKFVTSLKDMLHEKPEGVLETVRTKLAEGAELTAFSGLTRREESLMLEVLMGGNLATAADEIAAIGRKLYLENFGAAPDDFEDSLTAITEYIKLAFIPMEAAVPETVSLRSRYDIAEWICARYDQPLANYKYSSEIDTNLKIRVYRDYKDLWNWDATTLDKYKRMFSAFNSSNRRRHVLVSEEPQESSAETLAATSAPSANLQLSA